jgi:hypothetical protein
MQKHSVLQKRCGCDVLSSPMAENEVEMQFATNHLGIVSRKY